jgi:hypothetical protein
MRRAIVVFGILVLMGVAVGTALSAASPLAEELASLLRPSDDESAEVHTVATVEGEEWALGSYASERGNKCIRQTVPGEGTGITCMDPAVMFRDGDVLVMPGARQRSGTAPRLTWDNLWLQGFVSGRVATLQVVNTDCTVEEIPFDDDGAFMHVVDKTAITRESVPHKVIARDQIGKVIYEREISFGVPDNGKAAGLKAPRPKPECA